jgi:hypothetical protein
MRCSVRLNNCCRGKKTFLTMSYFPFNGAPGEHAGPEGSLPGPVQPPLDRFFDRLRPLSSDGGPRWSKDAHSIENAPPLVRHRIF